jgi:RNA polymerase sigma-70 factor (sigma-E family)
LPDVEFADFVAARSRALLRTAYALTGDYQRAEDLLQTALLKSYRHWSGLREPEAYLRQVMVRTYASWWQRRWRGEIPVAELPDSPDASAGADSALRDSLIVALATLPPRQRAVLVMRFFEELSDREIAELLNVSTGTVKSQASRALARLRDSAAATPSTAEETK